MANKEKIFVIRGELNWTKLTGDARPYTGNPKYDKGPYWSVDITPDAAGLAALKAAGVSKKLREPSEKDFRKENFLTLKIQKNKADGSPNLDRNGNQIVPKIFDASGRDWGNDLIGNGSVGDIMVKAVDYGDTKGLYFQKMRVLKHEKFEGGNSFEPLSDDDEFFAGGATASASDSPSTATEDDLEDEIPF